ncbi:transposase [Geminocystis sp.]|uniref:transposase n=1 Tax=Geminocystis sp. TaxID=2664100 RepID=UPI003592FEFF
MLGVRFRVSSVISHNKRAKRNKVFQNLAHWRKSSIDWSFGFKVHLIIRPLAK